LTQTSFESVDKIPGAVLVLAPSLMRASVGIGSCWVKAASRKMKLFAGQHHRQVQHLLQELL